MQVKNIKSVTVVAITTEQLLSKRKSNQFIKLFMKLNGFPGGIIGKKKKKKSACQCGRHKRRDKRCGFNPWVGKIPLGRKWQSTPVFLPGKFHGRRKLVGYNPWGAKKLDTTK